MKSQATRILMKLMMFMMCRSGNIVRVDFSMTGRGDLLYDLMLSLIFNYFGVGIFSMVLCCH